MEIIANDQGHRITPSWVSFTDDERLYVVILVPFPTFADSVPSVGDSAKNILHSNPKNTVFDAKRLIGRKMDDNELKRDIKHWPFGVINNGGKPVIQVEYRGETREFVGFSMLLAAPRETQVPCADARGNQRHGSHEDEGNRRGIPR